MQDADGIFGPPGTWWCSWQGAWYRRAGSLWIRYVNDQEEMERLALAGADGSMEVGPHGFPLSFMNVLAQEHPSQAQVDV